MMSQAAREMADRLHILSEGRAAPVGLMVPVASGAKTPMVPLKDGKWTEAASRQWFEEHGLSKKYDLGMSLIGLVVIDFDEPHQYGVWAAEHPELENAPTERTNKGMHVYFLRCPAVEAAGLYDGEMIDPYTGKKANIDLKTIRRSGAPGFILCAPSTNKEWLPGRSLLEIEPPTMTPGLLRTLVEYNGRG